MGIFSKEDAKLTSSFLEKKLKKILKRDDFRQNLQTEMAETLQFDIEEFQEKIARNSWRIAQKWTQWDEDPDSEGGPILLSDATRLYYRKGNIEAVVQEFHPQPRLIKIGPRLSGKKDVQNYSLAMPYVVFIFSFKNGLFENLWAAFNDRPMRKLNEKPLKPYLSNIDVNLQVCLGNSFDKNELEKGNINQQTTHIVSYFWQSVFNGDHSSYFTSLKEYFENTDSRLSSLENWQEATRGDSLFVIDDVDWPKHDKESFGKILTNIFLNDTLDSKFQKDLYKEISKSFLENINQTIQKNIENVIQKAEEQSLKSIADKLMKEIESLV